MRGLFPTKARGPNRVVLAGSFITVSSSNPTATQGHGFTVTRSGTGLYTITYDDAVQDITAAVFTVGVKTFGTPLVVTYDIDNVTTKAIPIEVSNLSGTAADDAGSEVSWVIVARRGGNSDPQP